MKDTRPSFHAFQADLGAVITKKGHRLTHEHGWTHQNLVKVPVADLPGFPSYGPDPNLKISNLTLYKDAAQSFRRVWVELHLRGLTQHLKTYDGAFNIRKMRYDGAQRFSTHAFGLAIDFNAKMNGYGLEHDKMEMHPDVVGVFEKHGWQWGGRWSHSDGMHFQWTQPMSPQANFAPPRYGEAKAYALTGMPINTGRKLKIYENEELIKTYEIGTKRVVIAFEANGDVDLDIWDN